MTNEEDVGADYVVRELGARGVNVVRLNTERAPDWRLRIEPGLAWEVRSPSRSLTATECAGVWWRRIELPARPAGVEDGEAQALGRQWRTFFAGLETVPGPRWVSSPAAIDVAENKARQLTAARGVGLLIPDTVWTNDRAAAERLIDTEDAAVVKSVATAYWETDAVPHFVFARTANAKYLPEAESFAGAPVCFQLPITPKDDVRVTVVGDRYFAAAREAGVNDPLDWRLGDDTRWHAIEIPEDVGLRCTELTTRLSLRFSGIDLARDAAGTYWFIELNPNGEWGWLEASGLPIAAAIADELTAGVV